MSGHIIYYYQNKTTGRYAKQFRCYCGGWVVFLPVMDKRRKAGYRLNLKNCYPSSMAKWTYGKGKKIYKKVSELPEGVW